MSAVTLHPSMGPAIIEHLSKFCDLPSRGLMAGQAVASAVSELYSDGRAVRYNDVDVFTPGGEEARKRLFYLRNRGREEKAIGTISFDDSGDGYRIYSVARVLRDGMLNTIEYEHAIDGARHLQAMLASFDFNNVQVGVDLSTKELYWTRHFEEFLHSHQLEIVRLHTPLHSLIRYFTKREELDGVYGNDERMIEMVAAAHQFILTSAQSDEEAKNLLAYRSQWKIGTKFQQKLAAVAGKLTPHFDFEHETVNGYVVQKASPRFEVDRDLAGVCTRSFVQELPLVSKLLRERPKSGMASRAEHLLQKPREKTPSRRYFLDNGMGFVRGNVSPSEMQMVDKLLVKHPIAKRAVTPTGSLVTASLSDLRDFVKLAKQEASARGEWVFGYLESYAGRGTSIENMAARLDAYWESQSIIWKPALLAKERVGNYEVTELLSGQALIREGEVMHHCIGGYGTDLQGPYIRAFHFQPPGGRPSDGFSALYRLREWDHAMEEKAPITRKGFLFQVHPEMWIGLKEAKGLQNRILTFEETMVLKDHLALTTARIYLGPLLWSLLTLLPEATQLAYARSLDGRMQSLFVERAHVSLKAEVHQCNEARLRAAARQHLGGLGYWLLRRLPPSVQATYSRKLEARVTEQRKAAAARLSMEE